MKPRRPRYPMPAQVCGRQGCPNLATPPATTCPDHRPPGWVPDRVRGTRTERGYGNEWQILRKQILNRDYHTCQACQGTKGPLHVDHLRPRHTGGQDNPENLQTLCQKCHAEKTTIEAAQIRKMRGK
jgi:5-methylcytosine-specific restriction protein A